MPILYRLGQVCRLDALRPRQIRDGAPDLEQAVIGAGAELHLLGGRQRASRPQHSRGHGYAL